MSTAIREHVHLRRVAELGSVTFSSSSVLSRLIDGGGSCGLRKWLIVSNLTVVVSKGDALEDVATYSVVESLARRRIWSMISLVLDIMTSGATHHLRHLQVSLLFPSYTVCIVEIGGFRATRNECECDKTTATTNHVGMKDDFLDFMGPTGY